MLVQTGPESMPRRWRPVAWLALATFLLNPALVLAQSGNGLLQPGDTIKLSVPGRPELDRETVLDANGQVTIEPVGTVQLGGLNLADATQLLKQKLRLFYPTLDVVQLEAGQAGSVRIYVLGSVSQKGVLNFEAPPSLWDVVRAIGGPLEGANLSDARVIREVDGRPEVHPVNLAGLLDGQDAPPFQMLDGDTLVIPTLIEGIPGTDSGSGVKVFGSVKVPTIVPIDEGTPLMDVLMQAGAPTEGAEMQKIYWVHNDGVRNQATVVDLMSFLLTGNEAGNPLVYPGDTVKVEYDKPGWVRSTVPFVLVSLASLATVLLAYDRLYNE